MRVDNESKTLVEKLYDKEMILNLYKNIVLRKMRGRLPKTLSRLSMLYQIVVLGMEIKLKGLYRKQKKPIFRPKFKDTVKLLKRGYPQLQVCQHCHGRGSITTCDSCGVYIRCATKIKCLQQPHQCYMLKWFAKNLHIIRMRLYADMFDPLDFS